MEQKRSLQGTNIIDFQTEESNLDDKITSTPTRLPRMKEVILSADPLYIINDEMTELKSGEELKEESVEQALEKTKSQDKVVTFKDVAEVRDISPRKSETAQFIPPMQENIFANTTAEPKKQERPKTNRPRSESLSEDKLSELVEKMGKLVDMMLKMIENRSNQKSVVVKHIHYY